MNEYWIVIYFSQLIKKRMILLFVRQKAFIFGRNHSFWTKYHRFLEICHIFTTCYLEQLSYRSLCILENALLNQFTLRFYIETKLNIFTSFLILKLSYTNLSFEICLFYLRIKTVSESKPLKIHFTFA